MSTLLENLKKAKAALEADRHGKPGSEARLLHKRHYVGQIMRLLIDAELVTKHGVR